VSSVSVGASFHLTGKQINKVLFRNPSNLKNWKKVLLGENKMHMVFVMTVCSFRNKITICITWRLLVLNLCRWFSSQCFFIVSMRLQSIGSISQAAMLCHTRKHTQVCACAHAPHPNVIWKHCSKYLVPVKSVFIICSRNNRAMSHNGIL